jgi:hypothetical protein
VLLPGFQKSRDIKASQGKGQGAVLAKKRTICIVQGKTLKMRRVLGTRFTNAIDAISCFESGPQEPYREKILNALYISIVPDAN